MPRDSQTKLKKEQNKRSKKDDEKKHNKKINNDSDSDDGDYESGEEMDVHEYRKFLSNLFPSKHLSKKIKAGEKIKKLISAEEEDSSEADEDWETESEEEEVPKARK